MKRLTNPMMWFSNLILILLALSIGSPIYASDDKNDRIEALSVQMFAAQGKDKATAIEELLNYNDKSLIPTFVLAMRWTGSNQHVAKALSKITGETISHWHEAYEWQERNPQIIPHETFQAIKLRFLVNTDKRFQHVLNPIVENPSASTVRLEEIVWGGVLFDGIASLDNPPMIEAANASYLKKSDLVFGVVINEDARAYPLRIMGWHEMLNDVIGGVPVALAYCTLCGSGILYETAVEGAPSPLVFGTSGLLYRSNKLMFDRQTQSLWNQFSGSAVIGPMADANITLNTYPITITTWEHWQSTQPNTTVLSLETGYLRNYDSGVTYSEYFASPELMFPAVVKDQSDVKQKDYVFGLQVVGASKAWPVKAFDNMPVINDQVGGQPVVLVGNPDTNTVRAFERRPGEIFIPTSDGQLSTNDDRWEITEEYISSLEGKQRRARLPGRISFWFAWENFMGGKSELYRP